jgi:hypothetical protein
MAKVKKPLPVEESRGEAKHCIQCHARTKPTDFSVTATDPFAQVCRKCKLEAQVKEGAQLSGKDEIWAADRPVTIIKFYPSTCQVETLTAPAGTVEHTTTLIDPKSTTKIMYYHEKLRVAFCIVEERHG